MTGDQIERILRAARRTKRVLDSTSIFKEEPVPAFGSGTVVGTGGIVDPAEGDLASDTLRQYVVQTGDTLSRIASNLGTTLTDLVSKNVSVFNQLTGDTRVLNPDLLFPGDILRYHRGGIVPGQRHTESLALLQGGETVLPNSPTNRHGIPTQSIVVQNLNVRGVWDFASPQAVDRLMDNVERQLEQRRRASGLVAV